ncbi:lysylphosphatidylglycerol synthase domain-containing protein [Microbacterium sp. NPDC056003]|uniref:lysylphosphatidylglycerol synthase domain-containing protein n=1 Tax=Microbacterium sp. NPDC056003 TaxID=3345676 RepID=UPI0035DF4377
MTVVTRPGTGSPTASAARWGSWIRAAIGLVVLVAIVAAVGAEPFVRGFAAVSPAAIGAAVLLAAAATAAAAWRWRILAGRLGLRLGWLESIGAYYRSQFLNTVLPGGVVGDVHRAVAHGRSVDQLAQAARAVAAERAAGQAVQLVLAVGVLAAIGFSAYSPAMTVLLVSVMLAIAALTIAAANRRARSALGREWAMLRGAFATPGAVLGVVASSTVVVVAHVATFLVACAAVGIDAPAERVGAAAVIAVLASSIPLSIGGWGPREGAAAWAFGAVGVGAAAGLTAATAYGALATIALAPGAAIVAVSLVRRRRGAQETVS